MTDAHRLRISYLVRGLALAILPFLVVDFVPATDLPQHAAQIRLLEEMWGLAPRTTDLSYAVARPFGAHALVYWPMFLLARVVSPRVAANLTLLIVVLASVVCLHFLAWKRERPPMHALLSGMLMFSVPLYWGFLNFLCGLPIFLIATHVLLRQWEARSWLRWTAISTVLILLLGWAHIFWIPWAGLAAIIGAVHQRELKGALYRAVSFAPATVGIALWIPTLAEGRRRGGFYMSFAYLTEVSDRISWSWLVDALFGGIPRIMESIVVAALLAWIGWTLLAARQRRLEVDRPFLVLGAAMLAFGCLAPDQYFATILLNERFLAISVMFILLALPWVSGRGAPIFAGLLASAFCVATAVTWSLYDQDDLSGLRESLALVDGPKRVLGLNYRRPTSVRNEPFLQTFAYFQAEHGGEGNFSFAQHQSSIVAYQRPRSITWTPGLEWFPNRLRERDVDQFDCILVNGEPEVHERFALAFGRQSRVSEGHFRLYCHDDPH